MLQSVRRVALLDPLRRDAHPSFSALAPHQWYDFVAFSSLVATADRDGGDFPFRAGYASARELVATEHARARGESPSRRVRGVIGPWSTCFDGVASLASVRADPDRTVFRVRGPAIGEPWFLRFTGGWLTGAVEVVGVELDSPFAVQCGPSGVDLVCTWSVQETRPLRPTMPETPRV